MSVTLEASPAAEAVRAQVDRILQSQIFRTSGVLRHLLGYLTEKCLAGESDTLKEYTIGIDALGKPESFDPPQESVVRMHTARLRQKLADYYRTEGAEDPIVLDMPKGGFKVTFEQRQPVAAPVVPNGSESRSKSRWTRREMGLAAALVLSLAAGGIGFARYRIAPESGAGFTPELKELWEPLISSEPAPGGVHRHPVVCRCTWVWFHPRFIVERLG